MIWRDGTAQWTLNKEKKKQQSQPTACACAWDFGIARTRARARTLRAYTYAHWRKNDAIDKNENGRGGANATHREDIHACPVSAVALFSRRLYKMFYDAHVILWT